jgi:hypothetical protein
MLAVPVPPHHPPRMFVVSETQAAAIRTAFERGGELSAALELRRLFPGITDNAEALGAHAIGEVARVTAGAAVADERQSDRAGPTPLGNRHNLRAPPGSILVYRSGH